MRAPDLLPDVLIAQLIGYKGRFGSSAAEQVEMLLEQLSRARVGSAVGSAKDLIRLHETVLFLRAYPQSARVAELADGLLAAFAARLEDADLQAADLDAFDDPEVSGIAGTAVSTNFSREFALSLATRHPPAVQIDWEDYENSHRLGPVLARLIPEAYEDWAVEPHADWRAWWQRSAHDLAWLLDQVDSTTWELLEIPLRWSVGEASRSTLRLARGPLYCHSGPLLKRSDVSIEEELRAAPLRLTRLPLEDARRALGVIVDASAARYRELYGFQFPDEAGVDHADLGRGMDLYWFRVSANRRLPRRAYRCGMYFKNGVPMGYVETLSNEADCEVGFNLYYTFREGETAWLYAQILKLLHQELGAAHFLIDPYQLGHENEEAVASGAFWFYYKLGFRPVTSPIAGLAKKEAGKIAARPGYRSSPAMLRRLASVSMEYRAQTATAPDEFPVHTDSPGSHRGAESPEGRAEARGAVRPR